MNNSNTINIGRTRNNFRTTHEKVYNQKRLDSALDYRSTVQFEMEVALNTIAKLFVHYQGCSPPIIDLSLPFRALSVWSVHIET